MSENITENNRKPKRVTLEGLAGTVETLTGTVESLAERFDSKFAGLTETVDDLAASTAKGFEVMQENFSILENGQEDIKLRLDHVAYRFEFVDLKKRVERLEDKTGIS